MLSLLQSVRFRFLFLKKLRYFKSFFSNSPAGSEGKGRILLYAGIPDMYLSPYEILFYHLLKMRGYKVDYAVYDEKIPINELITEAAMRKKGKDAHWNPLVRNGMRMLSSSGIEPLVIPVNTATIEKIMPPKGAPAEEYFNFSLDGIHLGHHVSGVIFRFYKSTTLGPDAADIARKFLSTTLSNYLFFKELCSKNKYHSVLFSHGIYCTWGPLTDYCLRHHIPFVCYDRGKTKETLNINFSKPAPVWDFESAWIRYRDKQLNKEENHLVDAYFRERELQKGDVFAYNFSPRKADVDALKAELGIPAGRKVVTIFSNLIWDAANVSRDIAFPSALECILQTIRHFGGRQDVQILLRSHPAEKVLGTSETYKSLVLKHFTEGLPENFGFLDYDVNSYNVLDISDIGVVNTSTVGLEFAMVGKPILLISETHYRGKGFTYDAENREHYFKTLESLIEQPDLLPQQVELARKYYYMMMYLYQHKLPLEFKGKNFLRYAYPDFATLNEEDNEIRQILDGIESGRKDFIFWD